MSSSMTIQYSEFIFKKTPSFLLWSLGWSLVQVLVLTLTEGWCKSFEAPNNPGSKIGGWHDSECATICLLHAAKLKDHSTFFKTAPVITMNHADIMFTWLSHIICSYCNTLNKTPQTTLQYLLQFLYRGSSGFAYLLYSMLHYTWLCSWQHIHVEAECFLVRTWVWDGGHQVGNTPGLLVEQIKNLATCTLFCAFWFLLLRGLQTSSLSKYSCICSPHTSSLNSSELWYK